jgi:capsule polysaccharide modification protein KpsS
MVGDERIYKHGTKVYEDTEKLLAELLEEFVKEHPILVALLKISRSVKSDR